MIMKLATNTTLKHTRSNAGQDPRRPDSSTAAPRRSPTGKKPYKSFPLTPHRNGQFCKKIRGKFYYFGTVADPDQALANYHRHCDGLHSGQVSCVSRKAAQITLRELANEFLNAAASRRDAGRLASRTFADYHRVCGQVIGALGRDLPVAAVTREHFSALHRCLSDGVSATTLDGRIGIARSLFKFAYDEELIEQPLRLKALPRPEKRVLRVDRAKRGRRHFIASEIRAMLEAASTPLRAMILLGINCGLGNTDIAKLTKDAIDLDRRWLDYPRPKTGVSRRCPLWPETASAIQLAIQQQLQRGPVAAGVQHLLFVTRKGNPFVRSEEKVDENGSPVVTEHDAIVTSFKRLMAALGIAVPGLGFYGLRRSLETIGGETGHQVAVDHIMGHAPASGDMGAVYRQHVAESSLRSVTDYVRAWLFGPEVGEAADR
jgi:integrase